MYLPGLGHSCQALGIHARPWVFAAARSRRPTARWPPSECHARDQKDVCCAAMSAPAIYPCPSPHPHPPRGPAKLEGRSSSNHLCAQPLATKRGGSMSRPLHGCAMGTPPRDFCFLQAAAHSVTAGCSREMRAHGRCGHGLVELGQTWSTAVSRGQTATVTQSPLGGWLLAPK